MTWASSLTVGPCAVRTLYVRPVDYCAKSMGQKLKTKLKVGSFLQKCVGCEQRAGMSDSMATGPRNPSYTDAVKAPALRQEPSTSTALIDSQPGGAHRGAYGSTADGSTATLSPLSNKTSRQGSQHGVSRSSSRGVIPVDGASGQAGSLLGHKYEDENEGVVDESNVSRCGPLDSMHAL